MAIKVKIPRFWKLKPGTPRAQRNDMVVRTAVAAFILGCTALFGVFAWYYVKYDRIVTRRMHGQIFSNASKIYALPETVQAGEKLDAHEIAAKLRRAGYTDAAKEKPAAIGSYRMLSNGIEVRPGPESYHAQDTARITIRGEKVESITSGENKGNELEGYELEPQLVTNLFDTERSKREIIKYNQIPKVMVDAVLAIEDRRFFQHAGVNYIRLLEAAWIDLRQGKHEQGGSTLTMQISRGFFLTPQKTIKRKVVEMLIAIELEQKFSKQQIFELYANQVYMGQRGSFTINGFAEAAHAYFNKDQIGRASCRERV